jgi:hypothetical protein
MAIERISQPSPDPNDDDMGQVTPIRSSEGRIILEAVHKLTDAVMELETAQGRLTAEIANVAAKTHLMAEDVKKLEAALKPLERRVDSMRPKVESFPHSIDVSVVEALTQKELSDFRAGVADKKLLRFEVYKAVIAVVVASLLGVGAKIGYDVLIWQAAHAHSIAH